MRKHLGLTLLELLLALALGAALLLALGRFVAQARQLTVTLESVDKLLDQQRLSGLLVQQDIQMAGFRSCLSDAVTGPDGVAFKQHSVSGWEALGTAPGDLWQENTQRGWVGSHGDALPRQVSAHLVPGSDVLVINRAVHIPLSQWISSRRDGDELSLRFAESIGVRYGEKVMLADLSCHYSITLKQSSRRGHTLTVQHQDIPAALLRLLEQRVQGELQLLTWQSLAYYVGYSNNDKGLYRRRLDRSSAPAEELIRGVLTQQLLFGEADASRSRLTFHPADQVQQWQHVRALHWGLLLAEGSARQNSAVSVLGVQGWDEASATQWPIERSFSLRQTRFR